MLCADGESSLTGWSKPESVWAWSFTALVLLLVSTLLMWLKVFWMKDGKAIVVGWSRGGLTFSLGGFRLRHL